MRHRYVGFAAALILWIVVTMTGVGLTTWLIERSDAQKYVENFVDQYANLIMTKLQFHQLSLSYASREIAKTGIYHQQAVHQILVDLQKNFNPPGMVALVNAKQQVIDAVGNPQSFAVLHTSKVTQATKSAYEQIFKSRKYAIGPPLPNSAFPEGVMVADVYPISWLPGYWLVVTHPVVFAVLPPEHLVYQGAAIAVLRSDGLLQSRFPYPNVTSYGHLQSGVMMQYLKTHPKVKSGVLAGLVTADGQQRITAFQSINGTGLYVGVSIPFSSVFAQWWRIFLPLAGTSFGLVAIAGLIFLAESRYTRKMERAKQVTSSFYSLIARWGELTQEDLSEAEFMEKALAIASDNQEFSAAALGVLRADEFVCQAIGGTTEAQMIEWLAGSTSHLLKESWATGEVKVIDELSDQPLPARSLVILPIKRNGIVSLLLILFSKRANIEDSEEYRQFSHRIVWDMERILDNYELKNKEREARRLADRMQTLYQVLFMIGEMAQRPITEKELFQLICDTLVAKNVFMGSWVGAPDDTGRFRFYAYSGQGMKEYLEQTDIRGDENVAGLGPAGRTWRTKTYQVEDNWDDSEIMNYWQTASEATAGWKMSANFPIFRGQTIYAVLAVYHTESYVFDDDLAQLGKRIVELVGQLLTNRDLASDLKLMENRYNLLLENMAEGVLGTDLKGIILFANAASERMLGYSKEELIGQDKHSLFHHNYEDGTIYPTEECLIDQAIARQSGIHIDNEVFWRKDGTYFPVDYRLEPVINGAGTTVGAVITFQDITAHMQAEEELKKAKEEAESASRVKGEFLANMSHEIRTPMNAILGLTQMLMDTALSSRQADYLEKMYNSSRALLGLLNDILDYSKLEAGRMELDRTPFVLADILQNVQQLFSVKAEEKRLRLEFRVAEDVPRQVNGDPLRLTQVLNNLVGNAIKFTDKGEVNVQVEVEERLATEWRLRFTVRDTGIGIEPEPMKRLFQAFVQGDSSISRKYGGTGLGLTISQQFVALMGGAINVISEAGKGSTFKFTILVGAITGIPRDDEIEDKDGAIVISRELKAPGLKSAGMMLATGADEHEYLTRLFRDLWPYLLEQEVIPEELIDELTDWTTRSMFPELFHRLLNQIDQFDQTGAKSTLLELAQIVGIRIEND